MKVKICNPCNPCNFCNLSHVYMDIFLDFIWVWTKNNTSKHWVRLQRLQRLHFQTYKHTKLGKIKEST